MDRSKVGLAAVALLAAPWLSACGDSSDASQAETPTMADLTGGTWVADSVDAPDFDLVPGSSIVLTFEDESISVNAGCNTMNGRASIEGEDLVVTDMSSTFMLCDDALDAQDRWINAYLTAAPTIELLDQELTLAESDSEIQFQHSG